MILYHGSNVTVEQPKLIKKIAIQILDSVLYYNDRNQAVNFAQKVTHLSKKR